MTEKEQLEVVKKALNITGNYQDETLAVYMDEAKDYLRSAGVSEEILSSEKVIGVLSRGVSDLWNYGGGNATLSLYFYQRASQLVYESNVQIQKEENSGTTDE